MRHCMHCTTSRLPRTNGPGCIWHEMSSLLLQHSSHDCPGCCYARLNHHERCPRMANQQHAGQAFSSISCSTLQRSVHVAWVTSALMSCAAFGRPVDEVFSSLSAEPVASASLGQVYRGRVRDMYGGGEVAVKVQRPQVQASVALDLHLMRRFAEFCQTFPQVCAAKLWVSALLLDWSCMIPGTGADMCTQG